MFCFINCKDNKCYIERDCVLNLNLDGLECILICVGVGIWGVYLSFVGKFESLWLYWFVLC